jgi:hypothetical protein
VCVFIIFFTHIKAKDAIVAVTAARAIELVMVCVLAHQFGAFKRLIETTIITNNGELLAHELNMLSQPGIAFVSVNLEIGHFGYGGNAILWEID